MLLIVFICIIVFNLVIYRNVKSIAFSVFTFQLSVSVFIYYSLQQQEHAHEVQTGSVAQKLLLLLCKAPFMCSWNSHVTP